MGDNSGKKNVSDTNLGSIKDPQLHVTQEKKLSQSYDSVLKYLS